MIDIKFYQQAYKIKQLLQKSEITSQEAYPYFEDFRQKDPVVFNIETTNNCNQRCKMCPRTTQMTRLVGTMKPSLFEKIVEQIKPWAITEWNQWTDFVKQNYKVQEDEMSENNFFFYIVPKVITLHGYGEPLLDKYIVERIKILKEHQIPSYFSCNPHNITFEKGRELINVGLDYLKFSADNIKLFEKNEQVIKMLLLNSIDLGYKTTFIMDIVGNEKDYEKLQQMFKGFNVYMYLKSQDNQWYKQSNISQHSIHWLEPCQFPWSSMSIMQDGSVVPCGQDYNNEMVFGHANKESLSDIWNGEKYRKFRQNMLTKKSKVKCIDRCDMKLLGDF